MPDVVLAIGLFSNIRKRTDQLFANTIEEAHKHR